MIRKIMRAVIKAHLTNMIFKSWCSKHRYSHRDLDFKKKTFFQMPLKLYLIFCNIISENHTVLVHPNSKLTSTLPQYIHIHAQKTGIFQKKKKKYERKPFLFSNTMATTHKTQTTSMRCRHLIFLFVDH